MTSVLLEDNYNSNNITTTTTTNTGQIMLSVRARIALNSSYVLARAVTIALRYSVVRKQGWAMVGSSGGSGVGGVGGSGGSGDSSGSIGGENAVIEYPQQQRLLLPQLATVYAALFTGRVVWNMYTIYINKYGSNGSSSGSSSGSSGSSGNGDQALGQLHAITAGVKAYLTTAVSEGMEVCREACGGHGFLVSAGECSCSVVLL